MPDRSRLQPERISARPAAPLTPERFRFVASRDEDDRTAREEIIEREPGTTAAPGLLPPMLSTQVGALLSRYQETGTVATPVDVPLTRRAPMRARREERVVTEDADAAATPESRSERARTFGRGHAASGDTATTGDATTGIITKIVKARGFGFLRDGAGTERFFHRNDVSGADFDTLQVAQPVRFTPDPTATGPRPIARAVEPVAS
jgi:cold shock CspA family protein